MPQDRVERAARNNAAWCDAVCRAHGAGGEMHASAWFTRHPPPPFYPNLVTLSGARAAARQLAHLERLLALPHLRDWAAKDSHAALDLAPLGMRVLFEASWIWRDASPVASLGPEWSTARVDDGAGLAAWELAWNGGAAPLGLFKAGLLADPNLRFLSVRRAGSHVGGAVASLASEVVGLSNLHAAAAADADAVWAACVDAAQREFPGHPLVGYEGGDDLERARGCGFVALHPLRVWTTGKP